MEILLEIRLLVKDLLQEAVTAVASNRRRMHRVSRFLFQSGCKLTGLVPKSDQGTHGTANCE